MEHWLAKMALRLVDSLVLSRKADMKGLRALPHLFGDIEVLKEAEQTLGLVPGISGFAR